MMFRDLPFQVEVEIQSISSIDFKTVIFLVVSLAACVHSSSKIPSREEIAAEVRSLSAEERTFLPEAYKEHMLNDIRNSDWQAVGNAAPYRCETLLSQVKDSEVFEMLEPVAVAARYGDDALSSLRDSCRAVPNTFYWGGKREEVGHGEHGFRLYSISDEVSLLSLENVRQNIDITRLGEKREPFGYDGHAPLDYYGENDLYLGRGSYFRVLNPEPWCRVRQVKVSNQYSRDRYKQLNYFTENLPFQDFVVLQDAERGLALLVVLFKTLDQEWIPEPYRASTTLNIVSLPTEDFGAPPRSRYQELWPFEDVSGGCEFVQTEQGRATP